MSWSLRLHSGDFALNGTSFDTVVNEQKLVQDLRCALLEPMGTDDMHPEYGSLIDGGRMPDGSVAPSLIGEDVQRAAQGLYNEIQRIARGYQAQQLNRAKSDLTTYNRASLSPAEVLIAITDITLSAAEDSLTANVELQTASGQSPTLVMGIGDGAPAPPV